MGRFEPPTRRIFFKASEIHSSDALSNMHIAIYEQAHGNPRGAIAHYQTVLLNTSPPHIEANIYQSMGPGLSATRRCAEGPGML